MRSILTALALIALAACNSQSPEPPSPPETAAPEQTTSALVDALTPLIAAEIGQNVQLDVTSANIQNDWAYIVAQPRQLDGSAIDWSTTALASREENGAMDAGGGAHALLKQENGVWRVVTHVIAPTDMAWVSWPNDYGVPPEVLGLPAHP